MTHDSTGDKTNTMKMREGEGKERYKETREEREG
jgi:hypothetical protein